MRKHGKRLAAFLGAGMLIFSWAMSGTAAGLEDIFDPVYYADTYEDLEKAFGYDGQALLRHYREHGRAEGRRVSPYFDAKYYRETYSDLDAAFGDDWDAYYDHYLRHGLKEGRSGAEEGFDAQEYLSLHPELKETVGEDPAALFVYCVDQNRVKVEGEGEPAVQPTAEPAVQPTAKPAVQPTAEPAAQPTAEPVVQPTEKPASQSGENGFQAGKQYNAQGVLVAEIRDSALYLYDGAGSEIWVETGGGASAGPAAADLEYNEAGFCTGFRLKASVSQCAGTVEIQYDAENCFKKAVRRYESGKREDVAEFSRGGGVSIPEGGAVREAYRVDSDFAVPDLWIYNSEGTKVLSLSFRASFHGAVPDIIGFYGMPEDEQDQRPDVSSLSLPNIGTLDPRSFLYNKEGFCTEVSTAKGDSSLEIGYDENNKLKKVYWRYAPLGRKALVYDADAKK